MVEVKEGWVRRGKEVWKVAPGHDDIFVARFELEAIADWVIAWSVYFHPMHRLREVASEVERYLAGRFDVPVELRKALTAAVETVDAVAAKDDYGR